MQVIEAKAFAATYRVFKSAKEQKDLPQSPLMDLVREVSIEVDAERMGLRAGADTEGLSGDDD